MFWSASFVIVLLVSSCSLVPIQEDVAGEIEGFLGSPKYDNYDEVTNLFKQFESEYPKLVRLQSIGRSVKNRELWVLEINGNVNNRSLLTPMFKYVANMHGDEPVGRQLVIYLAQYLLENYGKVDRVTKLVDSVDIHLMPSMNPDGYENSFEGHCESRAGYVGRENENRVDLNRDFPDQYDPAVHAGTILSGRQPETVAMMTWIISRPFVLSGNLHGGALVASYPFDDSNTGRSCCKESLTVDNNVFKQLALTYSLNHQEMSKGDACPLEKFEQGITNGAFWYEVHGGMQDFNYVHSNCFEVTFELSCCRFPPASSLPSEWKLNKEPMIKFIEAVHWGVKGLVRDAKGEPVLDADVVVEGINHNVTTSNRGEYWRLLLPGEYKIFAVAYGFETSQPAIVRVTEGKTARQDFLLNNLEPQKVKRDHGLYQIMENTTDLETDQYGFYKFSPPEYFHHNYDKMVAYLKSYNSTYPNITDLKTIGQSVEGRELYVFVIGKDPLKHVAGRPEFKYIANMHGDEVVGREMLLLLIKYLCESYGKDKRVTQLLDTTRIHIMPSMNPDGYEAAARVVANLESGIGRVNAHKVDLNRNFPDQFVTNQFNRMQEPETTAVMKWTLSEPFVLSANLHNGALVANYPFDDNVEQKRINTPSPDDETFKYLAHTYSNAHKRMHEGHACPLFPKENFVEGITNGAMWYIVTGGMQDWNYVFAGCMELTIELGCTKFPTSGELPGYWLDNRDALIAYIEQVHKGVYGYVFSTIGHPIPNAAIVIEGIQHTVKTYKFGDYWRILVPGKYRVRASARGYESYTQEVTVPEGEGRIQVNFTLMRDDALHWGSAYDFGIIENQMDPKYHSNQQINSVLATLENRYPGSAEFSSGENFVSMTIRSLKIKDEMDSSEETKFHVAILGNLFATQPVGREIAIYLARHLLQGHQYQDPNITTILNNAVVHVIPVVDSAFEKIWGETSKSLHGNPKPKDPGCNNITADFKQVGEQILVVSGRSSGINQQEANAFKHMLLDEKFDLVLNIEGGGSGMIYPLTRDELDINRKFAEKYTNSLTAPHTCTMEAKGTNNRLTDYIYHEYNTPMFTAKVSCCEYPVVENVPYIWKEILIPIKNFLNILKTGVEGFVTNLEKKAMKNATVAVRGVSRTYEVTARRAHYKIMLPEGQYELEVNCHGYSPKLIHINIPRDQIVSYDIILDKTGSAPITTVHVITEEGNDAVRPSGIHESGIEGFVRDNTNRPVSDAKVHVTETNQTTVTDQHGRYNVTLPPGKYTVKVNVDGYESSVKYVDVSGLILIPKFVIFTLVKDASVMGLPRLVFVIFSGTFCVGMVLLFVFGYTACKKRRRKYGLVSQLAYDEEFQDYDETKETEIFSRPTERKKLVTRPYFDDDEDDDDESDRFSNISSEDEIVLLQTEKYSKVPVHQ